MGSFYKTEHITLDIAKREECRGKQTCDLGDILLEKQPNCVEVWMG